MKLFTVLDPILSLERKLSKRMQPNGVLIISCGGIGDQFLFSLYINQFKKLLKKEEKLTLAVRQDTKSAEFVYPKNIEIIYVNLKKIRHIHYRRSIGKKLHKKHFRLVISADELRHPDTDEYLIAAAKGSINYAMCAKPSNKHRKKQLKRQLMYHHLYTPRTDVRDKLERWDYFMAWLMQCEITETKVAYSSLAHSKKPLILLAPFSGNPKKHYDVTIFLELINQIPRHYNIVLCAHKNDLKNNLEFNALLSHPRVSINTQPFEQQAILIKCATLVICIDSAFLHLAALFDANIIALMSAAYLKEYPYYPHLKPNIRFIYQEMDCKNCLGSCIHDIKNNRYPCVDLTNNKSVTEQIKKIIKQHILEKTALMSE